jgi:hypothetical protein
MIDARVRDQRNSESLNSAVSVNHRHHSFMSTRRSVRIMLSKTYLA